MMYSLPSQYYCRLNVFSLLEHKEFRFLMPILPLCMHVCGTYLNDCCDDAPDESEAETAEPTHTQPADRSKWKTKKGGGDGLSRKRFVVIFLVVTNLPIAIYTCLIHQRGTVDVMKYLHDEAALERDEPMKVMFLMPCHSTPFHR